MALGGPLASLGFWFFILSSQVHGKPDDCCQDFQKLQVQKGDEDGASSFVSLDTKAGLPARQLLLIVPRFRALVPFPEKRM